MIKKIAKAFITILTVCLFLFALLIIVLGTISYKNNEPLRIFGYSYSVVPTESMMPEIKPGDFIISKNVPYDELKIGDDVVYHSEKGIYIVHRIIKISEDGSEITVKGINNPREDDEFVTASNYVGKVVKHGNFLSLGKLVLNKRYVLFAIVIIMFLVLLLTEATNIYRLVKEAEEEKAKERFKARLEEEREKIRQELLKEMDNENK